MNKLIENISLELNNLTFIYEKIYNIQYLDEDINTNYDLNKLIDSIESNLVSSEIDKISKYYDNILNTYDQYIQFNINNKEKRISKLLLSNNKLFFIDNLSFKIKLSFENANQYLNNYLDLSKSDKAIYLTVTFLKKY